MNFIVNYNDDDDYSSIESEDIPQTTKRFKSASSMKECKVEPYEEVCDEEEEGSTESSGNSDIDLSIELKDMGFPSEQVATAIKACGKNSPATILVDFIQAQFCSGDEGVTSKPQHSQEEACDKEGAGLKESSCIDPEIELKDMGFPVDQVTAAIEACGKHSQASVLVDYIQAHYNVGDEAITSRFEESLQCSQVESCQVSEQESTPLKRLQNMGFSPIAVQNASEACGSIDFDDLLEHLINSENVAPPSEQECKFWNEMDWPEDNDSDEEEDSEDLFPFKKLERMGFTSSAINKAIDNCDSLDIEALLRFLTDDENVELQTESDDQKQQVKGKKIPMAREVEHSFKISKSVQITRHAGPSRGICSKIYWADERALKLWYSYLGLKTKISITPALDLDESASEDSSVLWLETQSMNGKTSHPHLSSIPPFKFKKGMGFGIPGFLKGRPKPLNSLMEGPPFFYFENVENVPNSEWETIKRHFNGIDPEFTDSRYFSACFRPRGYVHNLPVDGRRLILPPTPMTIFEVLPETKKYWPPWDPREKLNCINTRRAPSTLCGLIRKIFSSHKESEIPSYLQQEIVLACKRWNLVWVSPGQAAPLEPHEIELMLGYDRDHTRGCSTLSDRYDALGNSFQVNTVAYHLSPLKELYPQGLTVLSLFSGLGGAEVALHKLGIILKAVVIVEINDKCKNIIASWWNKTGQTGRFQMEDDVRDLTDDKLAEIVDAVGKIDLIIGGSPCNNLSGNNRVSRVGLGGKESCLFFEFPRILNSLKHIMQARGYF